MPDATITSTASTFGTISGVFSADQSTITGTITGVVAGTLEGSVGVPGPQGPAGAQGPQGEPGEPGPAGVGVPVGGTAGQVLAKVDGVDYNTEWINPTAPDFISSVSSPLAVTDGNLTVDLSAYAPIASPAFTGNPTAPTPATADNDTSIATTAFVKTQGYLTASALTPYLTSATAASTYQTIAGMSDYLSKANNLSDLANVGTARNNLGLGVSQNVSFRSVSMETGQESIGYTHTTAQITASLDAPGISLFNGAYINVGSEEDPAIGLTSSETFTLNKDGFTFENYPLYAAQYPAIPYNGKSLSYDALTGVMSFNGIGTGTEEGSLTVNNSEVLMTNAGGTLSTLLIPGGISFITSNSGGQIVINSSQITFNDETVQTTAFPGFNNAALTGNPTAPTATFGDNDTSIATTAFVQAGLLGGTANARNLEVEVRNQSGSTITAGSIVYISGATGNKPLITLAQGNNDANSAQTIGFVKTSIANNGTGYVIIRGILENIDTSALTEGVQLYLSPTTAGTWTTTKPSAPNHLVYVGIVIRSHPTQGTILVAVQNGYELDELHDVAIASKANNDLLAYESSTDLWKNKTYSALGLLTSADAASTYLTQANAASTYQTQAGMSSYLTTSAAASTYAPIASPTFTGTVTIPAGASISGFAPLASPTFTGTPSLPTGTTAVTQAAGNNTTAVATTAFVQQEVPDFATASEARGFTSTTTSLNPRQMLWAMLSPNLVQSVQRTNFTVTSTGTITSVRQGVITTLTRPGTAGACTSKARFFGGSNVDQQFSCESRANPGATYNFNLRKIFSGRSYAADVSNSFFNMAWFHGKSDNDAIGNLARRGFGWTISGGTAPRYVVLQVHDGTNLNTVTSSHAVTGGVAFDWDIESDGAGNVTLYINGSSVATSANGPTGIVNTAVPTIWHEEINITGALTNGASDAVHSRGRFAILDT